VDTVVIPGLKPGTTICFFEEKRMKHREKKFLKRPEYPGGKEAFRQYVKSNLKYPEEALAKGIGGIVYLSARIDDNGEVSDVEVEKGIGGGCDEEAVRLISSVHFGKVKNRGLRVSTRKKFRIEFRLPPRMVYTGKPVRQTTGNPSDPEMQIHGGEPALQSPAGETDRENPPNDISSPAITYQVSPSKKSQAPAAPAQGKKKYTYTIRIKPRE